MSREIYVDPNLIDSIRQQPIETGCSGITPYQREVLTELAFRYLRGLTLLNTVAYLTGQIGYNRLAKLSGQARRQVLRMVKCGFDIIEIQYASDHKEKFDG